MEKLGLTLEPSKGSHKAEACYVEYKGKVDKEKIEELKQGLNESMYSLISKGGKVLTRVMAYKDAEKEGIVLPSYIDPSSTPRIITMEEKYHCPCGGTHVKDVSEIGDIQITDIRVKKGITRVSYTVL